MHDSSLNHMRGVVNTHIAGQDRLHVADIRSYLFLIAPSKEPEHHFSLDCWRFYPDGYRALAKCGSSPVNAILFCNRPLGD